MGDKFNKLVWKSAKEEHPAEDGAYLILRETGSFAVANFEGDCFRAVGNIVAWAEIPVPDSIPAVPAEAIQMMQIQKKMCALRAQSRQLDREIRKKKKELQKISGFSPMQSAYYM